MEKHRVLVIDDSPTARRLIGDILSPDFDVTVAEGVRDAVEQASVTSGISVVVCDQKLPDGNGVEILRKIREVQPDAVALLLTAHSSVELLEELLNEQLVFRFIRKGSSPKTFIKAVQDCIDCYKSRAVIQPAANSGCPDIPTELIDSVFVQAPGLAPISERINAILETVIEAEPPILASDLRLAGSLVFVGMLKVPMEIVQKICAGEDLDSDEWDAFRMHPAHAIEIVKQIPAVRHVGPILASAFGHSASHPAGHVYAAGALRAAYDAAWLEKRIGTEGALAILKRDLKAHSNPGASEAVRSVMDAVSKGATVKEKMDYDILRRTPSLLLPGDELLDDVRTANGRLLLSKGQRLTARTLQVLRQLAREAKMSDTVEVVRVSAR